MTQFGKIDILLFDFTYPEEDGKNSDDWEAEEMIKMVRKLQAEIILNDRLGIPGSGDIFTPEQHFLAERPTDENGTPLV